MIEIRKLKKEDMGELFALLNDTFGHKYGRAMHFDLEQPKMWIEDDLHMERHIAVFEDGKMASVVGIYPLPAVIGGEEFLFCTTGNVATLPAYEGKGYFSKLFPLAVEEAKRIGAVAARLGGARQRYARYGYESCGIAYNFRVTAHNEKHAANGEALTLEEIQREDEAALAYCHALMQKKTVYVMRGTEEGFRDTYLALCSKEGKPYLLKRNGKNVGYISAKGDFSAIYEVSLEDEGDIFLAACAAARNNKAGMTELTVPPTMPKALEVLAKTAQEISVVNTARFNIFCYERLVNRLLKIKQTLSPLPECDLVLKIEGGEALLLHTGADGAFCKKTDKEPHITLTHSEAEIFLFGMLNDAMLLSLPKEMQLKLKAILPLPLAWCTNDYT